MSKHVVLAVALIVGLPALAASPPDRMNYQGVLRNSAGVPLNGSYDVVFRLFDSAVAGNEITVDTHTTGTGGQVQATGGLFNVAIGSGAMTDGAGPGAYTTLGAVFRDYMDVWLEVAVAGETLTPRIRVASAAFALNSQSLGGRPASSFLDTSATAQTKPGALVLTAAAPGPPQLELGGGNWNVVASDGDLKVGSSAYNFRLGVATAGGGAGDVRLRAQGGTNRLMLGGGAADDLTLTGGKVGINNLNPSYPLDVVGDAWFRGNTIVSGSLSLTGDSLYFNHAGAFFGGSESSVHLYGGDAPTDSLRFLANTAANAAGIDIFGSSYLNLKSGDGRVFFQNQATLTNTATLDPDGTFRVQGDLQAYGDQIRFLTDGASLTTTAAGLTVAPGIDAADDLLLRAGNSAGNGAVNINGDGELQLRAGSGLVTFFNDGGTGSVETARLDSLGTLQVDGDLRFGVGPSELREVGSFRDVEVRRSSSTSYFRVYNFEGQEQMRIQNGDEAPTNFDGPVNANGIDYAEAFHVSDPTLDPGDVVVLAPRAPGFIERSTKEYAPALVGVVSLRPGFVTGNSFDAEESADEALAAERVEARRVGDHERSRAITEQLLVKKAERMRPVALLGRVPVKVDGAFGPIRAGDVLTSSPTPGHAMRLGEPGPSIGIALEPWSSSARGQILAFIDPGWHGGTIDRTDRTEDVGPPPAELRPLIAPNAPSSPSGEARHGTPGTVERFEASVAVEVGDVVAIDPDSDGQVRPASEPADPAVVGVVQEQEGSADGIAVALAGTTRCRVDAGYGAIRPGDLLTTSPTPGHAMRAVDPPPGAVFAKALERLEVGTGTIRVLLWAR